MPIDDFAQRRACDAVSDFADANIAHATLRTAWERSWL